MEKSLIITLMKCANISALDFGVLPLSISWTVQKLVWLKRLVNATIFGVVMCLFFFVQAQLVNSSGWMAANTGKSRRVIWLASSSGETRKALQITASRSVSEVFGGRLLDFLDAQRLQNKVLLWNYSELLEIISYYLCNWAAERVSDGELSVVGVVVIPLPPLCPLSEFFFVLANRITSAKSLALLVELLNENLSRFFFSAEPGIITAAALLSGAIRGPVLCMDTSLGGESSRSAR